MRSNIQDLKTRVDKLAGKRDALVQEIETITSDIKTAEKRLLQHQKALEILKEVGLKTQKSLQFHISDITSMAMEAVFPDPYTLKVEFLERRNKTECDISFELNGNIIEDPLNGSGGGDVDVAAYALRIASWTMQHPRTRNTIILDEPFHFLSVEYQEQASQMIKEISHKLGIQFIIVTHSETLASFADKVFRITKTKRKKSKWRISKVE